MKDNIDNILNSINQLSAIDKLRILHLLQEQQQKKVPEDEAHTFMSERIKGLEDWSKRVKKLLKANKEFFNELEQSA